jgi:hypothetical protein
MAKHDPALLAADVPSGVTVSTHCDDCGGALELAFELRPSADRLRPVVLTCPYCGEQAHMQTARRLLWVAQIDAASDSCCH